MKLLIFSDVHWSTYSSIIRKQGKVYSQRLELLLASMNWVNQIAIDSSCEAMVCAGDFFDKAQLTDMELTALRDIKWNDLPCYFLCGNHESSVSDLRFNALKALESQNHLIISDQCWSIKDNKTQLHFVPYIVETDRQNLENYLDKNTECTKHIVISHNDIAGINYGGFTSKSGFNIEEIEASCDLYLNGHLHNSEWITKKILNVGSLSAHNFTNDSSKYSYGIWILDTETLKIEFIENPYSLNFYKFEIENKLKLKKLAAIKNNTVVSIKCSTDLAESVKEQLNKNKELIIEQKLIIESPKEVIKEDSIIELRGEDHIHRLITFCHEKLDNTAILDAELAEICG